MNPNSLANLSREGRPPTYDEKKKPRMLTVTATGWDGVKVLASEYGLSVSELLERLGRKFLTIVDLEELEDCLDLQDTLEAEAAPENKSPISWEQVKQELKL